MVETQSKPRIAGTIFLNGKVFRAEDFFKALERGGVRITLDKDYCSIGFEKIYPTYKSRQEMAMSLTCHGSLAHCCPVEKECTERDKALELLNISKEDYKRLKEYFHLKLIEFIKGLWRPNSNGRVQGKNFEEEEKIAFKNDNRENEFFKEVRNPQDYARDYKGDQVYGLGSSSHNVVRSHSSSKNRVEPEPGLEDLFGDPKSRRKMKNEPATHVQGYTQEMFTETRCPRCNTKLPPRAVFCSGCGIKL